MIRFDLLELMRTTLMQVVFVSAPLLLIGVCVGMLTGLLQALTQIHDQSLSFAPKLIAVLLAFGLGLPWIMQHLSEFATLMFSSTG